MDEKHVGAQSSHASETSPDPGDGHGSSTPKAGMMTRFVDSFKRDPNYNPHAAQGGNKGFDMEAAAVGTADSPLARKLKGRHLQMIAIGGSIGMSQINPKF